MLTCPYAYGYVIMHTCVCTHTRKRAGVSSCDQLRRRKRGSPPCPAGAESAMSDDVITHAYANGSIQGKDGGGGWAWPGGRAGGASGGRVLRIDRCAYREPGCIAACGTLQPPKHDRPDVPRDGRDGVPQRDAAGPRLRRQAHDDSGRQGPPGAAEGHRAAQRDERRDGCCGTLHALRATVACTAA